MKSHSGVLLSFLNIWTNGIYVRVIEHLADIRLSRKKGVSEHIDCANHYNEHFNVIIIRTSTQFLQIF